MKKNLSQGNKTFCIAPWTHTFISPQSERRLCCASREKSMWTRQYLDLESNNGENEYNPKTLEEHWNSDYMKDIRKRLMSGEEIEQCQVCNHKLLNVDTYRDYFNKTLFPHKINEAFEKTSDDGYTEMKPISFDYRISNLCNFKCRMCGDQLSSAWEAEKRKMGEYSQQQEHNRWATELNKTKIKSFQKEVVEEELWSAVRNQTIEEIYWVGGEPLLWNIHWDVMKHLIESGHSKNVTVRYNTNLSKISHRGVELKKILPHFKHVQLSASIDGTGEIVEYIRDGIKWDKWLKNFKELLFLNDLYGKHGITMDLTVTTPGLFSLKDIFDLSLELNVNTYIKTTFGFDPTTIMCPHILPRPILDEILDDVLSYITPKIEKFPSHSYWKDSLLDIKNEKTFQESFTNYRTALLEGVRRLNEVDNFRGHNDKLKKILSQNNKASDWWEDINDEINQLDTIL
jgi:hypothetical protein